MGLNLNKKSIMEQDKHVIATQIKQKAYELSDLCDEAAKLGLVIKVNINSNNDPNQRGLIMGGSTAGILINEITVY